MLYLILTVTTLTGLSRGSPYLGGQVFQPVLDPYLYVTPEPYVVRPYQPLFRFHYPVTEVGQDLVLGGQPLDLVPRVHPLVPPSGGQHLVAGSSEEETPEVNQFHSEDAQGRVLYGFHGHNQARMEARDPQGRVRGSYSYLDPNGQVVRMDYWDDGSGFQARGHNLPKPLYDFPSFTPEVQAARDQHFKLYQQILLSTIHAQNKVPVDDYPYVERPDGASSSPTSGSNDDDTVVVGALPNGPGDLENRPGGQADSHLHPAQSPVDHQTPGDISPYPTPVRIPGELHLTNNQFESQNEEDLESIALDNPEFQDLGRDAKNLSPKESGTDKGVEEVNKRSKQDKKTGDEKTADKKEKSGPVENRMEDDSKHNGFAYQFRYNLPTPLPYFENFSPVYSRYQSPDFRGLRNSFDNAPGVHNFSPYVEKPSSELVKSSKAPSSDSEKPSPKYQKVSSIVSSEPIPPNQKTSLHNVRPLPLRTMTSMSDRSGEPTMKNDALAAPVRSYLQRPLVITSFPTPLVAVRNQVPSTNSRTDSNKRQ